MKSDEQPVNALESYPLVLREIVAAAERGGDRDWDYIDKSLSKLMASGTDAKTAADWAQKKGLKDKERNGHLRDLAASILELYNGNLDGNTFHELKTIAHLDAKKPAGFRAVCALWKHGKGEIKEEARKALVDRYSNHHDSVISMHTKELLAVSKAE